MIFVIAECGVNWRDLVDADDMIREAARAGADAVKFQAYNTIFSTVRICPEIWTRIPNAIYHPRADELNAICLEESTIRYLYWRCQQHGIEFMCTPMYPKAVAMLDPYVKRWKIRHADRENEAILEAVRKTGKPALISNDDWHENPGKDTILAEEIRMRCVPEYPPGTILCTKGHYRAYSCHIPWIEDPITWAADGCLDYLEVHVRLDKYEPHYCPIDTAVSITMSELAELCRRLKK
jgi:hypothetical protein